MVRKRAEEDLRITLCLSLLLAAGSCARAGYGVLVRDGDEDSSLPATWGELAATLDVPECPATNPVLVVTTTSDELDGGTAIADPAQAGDWLSFAEAIWLAANRATPHNIFFDPAVFPADAPGVIHLRDQVLMPASAPGLCIDGRSRGVVLEYDDETGNTCGGGSPGPCDLPLQAGALLVGLEFHGTRLSPRDSTIAGCRLDAPPGLPISAIDSTIGPGNLILPFFATRHLWAMGGEILDNFFNFDPLQHAVARTGPFLGAIEAISTNGSPAIRGNVFCDPSPDTVSGSAAFDVLVVEGNFFGVDREGVPIDGCGQGFSSTVLGQVRFGPGNIVRGVREPGVLLWATHPSYAVEITRNVITGNESGISVLGSEADSTPPPPPVISQASPSMVSGGCAVAGRVEVFSDPGAQGERFLGETTCEAGGTWSLAVQTSAGANATATLSVTVSPSGFDTTRTSGFSAAVPIE